MASNVPSSTECADDAALRSATPAARVTSLGTSLLDPLRDFALATDGEAEWLGAELERLMRGAG